MEEPKSPSSHPLLDMKMNMNMGMGMGLNMGLPMNPMSLLQEELLQKSQPGLTLGGPMPLVVKTESA